MITWNIRWNFKKRGKMLAMVTAAAVSCVSVGAGAQNEYTDTPFYDEISTYAADSPEIPVSLSDDAYSSLSEILGQTGGFHMSEYYALDEALDMYHQTPVNKRKTTALLTNGQLDADKLVQKVTENNSAVMVKGRNTLNAFYKEMDASDLNRICQEIADVINDRPVDLDMKEVANTLERLTMFKREGATSNAYVSTNLTLIYNPIATNGYETILSISGGSSENAWEQVIDHEIMHLIQYGSNDNNDDNGIEAGFCRMYNTPDREPKLPVDSLYFSWILEAGAELGMSGYLDVEPGTYQKKISYTRSYNLSRFYENKGQESMLERAVFKDTLEDACKALGLGSEDEIQDFLNFMYSVEITQVDTEDFWAYYEAQTGKTLTDDELAGIRMDIRTDAVAYMTTVFFENLIDAVHEGAVNDLDTVFYLLRLWELDVFSHLNYTQLSSLEHAEDFIVWYDQTQDAVLTAIANSSDLDPGEMQALYSEYYLQSENDRQEIRENCDLGGLDDDMRDYIISARQSYTTSHYSRIYDVARWMEE